MGCNVVIRTRNALYRYSLHFHNAFLTLKKSPAFLRKRDFEIYLSYYNFIQLYTHKLPLHFIAKVKVIKGKEEVSRNRFHCCYFVMVYVAKVIIFLNKQIFCKLFLIFFFDSNRLLLFCITFILRFTSVQTYVPSIRK